MKTFDDSARKLARGLAALAPPALGYDRGSRSPRKPTKA